MSASAGAVRGAVQPITAQTSPCSESRVFSGTQGRRTQRDPYESSEPQVKGLMNPPTRGGGGRAEVTLVMPFASQCGAPAPEMWRAGRWLPFFKSSETHKRNLNSLVKVIATLLSRPRLAHHMAPRPQDSPSPTARPGPCPPRGGAQRLNAGIDM